MKKTINKILKSIKNEIMNNLKFYITFIVVVPWLFIPFDYYIYMPGGLIELTDRIEVETDNKVEGSFNLTYVSSLRGTIPYMLMSFVIPNWDLESIDNSRIDEESPDDIVNRNKIFLKQTSYDAIIAAFKEANMDYEITGVDVSVIHIDKDAKTNVKVGDIIKKIDGVTVDSSETMTAVKDKHKDGDKVEIIVLRDDKEVKCHGTYKVKDDSLAIGIYLTDVKHVKTNPKVEYIFKDSESGSSRGLLCALEIYNKITEEDLTKGDIISGTGSIDSDGVVGSIDGVKYKLIGAHKKGAKVFIVPTENYEEAIKIKEENNYDIEIIEADTLHNVIEKLKER